jgi:hypothetical protein
MISKDKYNIEFVKLTTFAPQDTIWVKEGAELVGLSKSKKLHIVIDDGCCCDDDGKWLVNVYKIKDIEQHWNDFFPNEERNYFFKYPSNGDEEKLIEEWVDFTSWDDICGLREKIESEKCYVANYNAEEWDYFFHKCDYCKHNKGFYCKCIKSDLKGLINKEVITKCKENNNFIKDHNKVIKEMTGNIKEHVDSHSKTPFKIPEKCIRCANYYRGNCLAYEDYWNIDITQEVIDECEENNNYRESIIRLY